MARSKLRLLCTSMLLLYCYFYMLPFSAPAKPQTRDQRNFMWVELSLDWTVCADQRGGPDAPLFRSAAI